MLANLGQTLLSMILRLGPKHAVKVRVQCFHNLILYIYILDKLFNNEVIFKNFYHLESVKNNQ